MLREIVLSFIVLGMFYTPANSQNDDLGSLDSIDIEDVIISTSRAQKRDGITQLTTQRAELDNILVGQDPVLLIEELTPSVISYSDGGTNIGNYSQFRLRGMDQSRVNISLNGVPLNDMVDHGVYFSNFSDFGNSVESMQVVRGVGITNSGLASYAGAVNFESIHLFDTQTEANAQVTVGSFGTLRTAAEVNSGSLDNGVGIYARLTRTQTDGYKYNSGSDSYSMFFSGGYLTSKGMVKLTAFSGKTQNGQSYEHVPFSVIEIDPKTNYNNLNDVDDFEQHMVQLQWSHQLNEDFHIDITPYYNGAGGVFPYTFDGIQYMYGLTNDHYGVKTNIGLVNGKNTLNAGLHAYMFDRSNFEYVSPFSTEPYTRDYTDKDEVSAYLNYRTNFSSVEFIANVEGRFINMDMTGDESLGVELDESNDWSFVNGLLGFRYPFGLHSSAYLSMGRSHREPTRSDINNGVTEAERVHDLELGWEMNRAKFKTSINAFYMDFANEISEIGALQERSYIEIRQNIDNSKRYGLELTGSYFINKTVQSSVNLSFTDTNISSYNNGSQIFTDVEHIFSPKWIAQPSITVGKDLSAKLTLRYVSTSFSELSNNEDFAIPSHTTLHGRISYKLNEHWYLSAHLNNITNQLYFTEGSPIDADFDGEVEGVGYRVQPPRHFYIMIKYNL